MYRKHAKAALGEKRCEELAELAREAGFEKASVNYYGQQREMGNVRNNERSSIVDAALALELEEALKASLGADFPWEVDGRRFVKMGERLRAYRYRPGQYFKPHRDGSTKEEGTGLESEATALFYLNDADGGHTVLMPYGAVQKWAHESIEPRAGDALVFEHRMWHEGRPVVSGEKLVLRGDLFYEARADEGAAT